MEFRGSLIRWDGKVPKDPRVEDLIEIRRLLEPVATRDAAREVRTADLLTLRAMARELVDLARRGDVEEFAELDETFHVTILSFHHNPALAHLCSDLRLQTKPSVLSELLVSDGLLGVAQAHEVLLDRIEARALDDVETMVRDGFDGLMLVLRGRDGGSDGEVFYPSDLHRLDGEYLDAE